MQLNDNNDQEINEVLIWSSLDQLDRGILQDPECRTQKDGQQYRV